MPIITLTTDFGLKDPFVASVKGRIYSELPDAKVVDVSHLVSPFDIGEGAFIIKNAYKNFPEGSIHILGVDDLITKTQRPIAALIDGHYFLAANNGILSLIQQEIRPKEVVEIDIPQVFETSVFTTRDVFVPVACHLVRGGKLSVVGKELQEFKELEILRPVVREKRLIIGVVVYIDNYGNAITNISNKLFDEVGKKRNFSIRIQGTEFNEVLNHYGQIVEKMNRPEASVIGNPMALFGSSGYLEISMYKSNPAISGAASTLFGLKKSTEIFVEFY